MLLANMTWAEAQAALTPETIVLIPTAATEQHGPGGTLAVDFGRAEAIALRIAERVHAAGRPIVVAPGVRFGVSPHHVVFPGTISLDSATFRDVCLDIIDSLARHGVRKFMFVNGHGGNIPSLNLLIDELLLTRPELRVTLCPITKTVPDVRRPDLESPVMGHACQREMSQCLVVAPWTVRAEAFEPAALTERTTEIRDPHIRVAKLWDELSTNGALGDPTRSDAEYGQAIVDAVVERMSAWIVEAL